MANAFQHALSVFWKRRRWGYWAIAIACSVACFWLAERINKAVAQRKAVAVLDRSNVAYDYEVAGQPDWKAAEFYDEHTPRSVSGPTWLRRLLGDDFLSNVVVAIVNDDKSVARLDALPDVKILELNNLSGEGLQRVAELKGAGGLSHVRMVEFFDVYDQLTSAGVDGFLGAFPHVTTLWLDTDLTPRLTDCLARHVDLEDLSVKAATDADLRSLRALIKLRRLELRRSAISDSGIKNLDAFRELQYLTLDAPRVGGLVLWKTLGSLPKFKKLTRNWSTTLQDLGDKQE